MPFELSKAAQKIGEKVGDEAGRKLDALFGVGAVEVDGDKTVGVAEEKFVVPEKFEGPEYDTMKKDCDGIIKFLVSKGLDPEKYNFTYRMIVKTEPHLEDSNRRFDQLEIFKNYHDYLRRLQNLTDEEKGQLNTTWTSSEWGDWNSPSVFTDFYKEIDNPDSELYPYRDEILNIISFQKNGEAKDLYAEAIKDGMFSKETGRDAGIEEGKIVDALGANEKSPMELTEVVEEPEKESEKGKEIETALAKAREEYVATLQAKEKVEKEEGKLTGIRAKIGSFLAKSITGYKIDKMFAPERQIGVQAEAQEAREKFLKAQENYKAAIKTYRDEEVSKIEKKVAGVKVEDELDEGMKYLVMEGHAEKILLATTLLEAAKIEDLKVSKQIEQMGKTRRFINEKAEEFAEWYKKLPWQAKMGVSLGLMTGGIIAGTVGAAPIMAACFAGQMGLRSLGGAMTTVGVEGLVKKWQEKSGEKKLSKEFEGNFLEALKNKNDTLDDKLFELVKGQQSAKNKRMVVAGLTGGIVGTGILATAVKEAFGWGSGGGKSGIKTGSGVPGAEEPTAELTSLEEPPGSEPLTAEAAAAAASEGLKEHSIEELVFLEIGQRGPEGAIIDNFRANPELAKSFGWDGKGDISKWAGTKAHQLWLASVESELAKPGMAEKLTEQGFTPDVEGYAKAMHKLGQGVVELDPQGRISLSDNTSFLKAGAPALEELGGAAETASAVEAPLPEAPGPEIPAVKVPTPTEAIVTSVSEAKASLSAEDLIDQKIKATVTHSVDPAFLTDKTFKAAAKMTLGKLLEEVPAEAYKDKYALSNYWHSLSGAGVKTPNLPGTGFLGDLSYDDWRKYAEMAKLLRENPVLKSVTGLKNMTMEEFFHFYGGDLGKK